MRHDSASWRATLPGQPSLWDRLKFDLVAGSPEYRAMILRPEILRGREPRLYRQEPRQAGTRFSTVCHASRHRQISVKCHVGAETADLILTPLAGRNLTLRPVEAWQANAGPLGCNNLIRPKS